jgi:hypothetical protein
MVAFHTQKHRDYVLHERLVKVSTEQGDLSCKNRFHA